MPVCKVEEKTLSERIDNIIKKNNVIEKVRLMPDKDRKELLELLCGIIVELDDLADRC